MLELTKSDSRRVLQMFSLIAYNKKLLALAFCLSFAPLASGWADFKQEVAKDMSAKSAYLVAAVEDMWLIDADAKEGVQIGDLFSVIGKGEPIIHPATKISLGNLDEVIGVLRVVKVKSGYSYTEVVSGTGLFEFGTEVKRFANLSASFWDYTGDGEAVFNDLKAALPELDWISYVAAQQSKPETPTVKPDTPYGLLFLLTDRGLAVKDTQLQPIRFYRPQELTNLPITAATVTPAKSAPISAIAVATPSPQAARTVVPAQHGTTTGGSSKPTSNSPQTQHGGLIINQMDSKEGVWYGPRMYGQPTGVDVGDFDGNGKNDVALCFKDRLVLARIEKGLFTSLAEHNFGVYGTALSMDAMDLNHDGRLEFYISVVNMNAVKSVVLELHGNKLVRVIENAPYFVRKVHMGREGYVLLGQELNPDLLDHSHDLAGPIFRVTREGNHLQRAGEVILPNTLTLYGFMPMESGGRSLIANININDKLQALEMGGASLWESHNYFGGSESSFERPDGLYEMASRYAFIKPRIEPGPNQSILVPVNEGSRLFGSWRQFNSSHLRAVEFDGYTMVERWRTKPQGGYMADFRMADADNDGVDEIVMLVMFSHDSWLPAKEGNTALLLYEME